MYNNEIFYSLYHLPEDFDSFLDDEFINYNDLNNMRTFHNYGNNTVSDAFNSSFYEPYYLDYNRAPEQDINRILNLLTDNQPQLFNAFQRIIENYFKAAISFTLDNSQQYTGNIKQRVNNIFNGFRRTYDSIFLALRNSGIPNNVINDTFRTIIEFTLRNSNLPPVPAPPPYPTGTVSGFLNSIFCGSKNFMFFPNTCLKIFSNSFIVHLSFSLNSKVSTSFFSLLSVRIP
jgi:hypothetical protein